MIHCTECGCGAFSGALTRRVAEGAGVWGRLFRLESRGRLVAWLKSLAPYAAIELILPGGSLIALSLWLYRRYKGLTH